MSNIREYIALVEQELKEWPFAKKEPDISKRVFGRAEPLPMPPMTHNDYARSGERVDNRFSSRSLQALGQMDSATAARFRRAAARRYRNGDEYAVDISGRDYSRTDPPATRAAIDIEHGRLRNEWNLWREHGFV